MTVPDPCPVCQHEKREVIDAALAKGVAPGIVARRYRLDPLVFGRHVDHQRRSLQVLSPSDDSASLSELLMPENPYRQFTHGATLCAQAYQLAKDDPRMQRQMREYWQQKVQGILQRDDMGEDWG